MEFISKVSFGSLRAMCGIDSESVCDDVEMRVVAVFAFAWESWDIILRQFDIGVGYVADLLWIY